MKKFNEYLKEDFDPAIFNADGGMSINDPTVMDAINSNLEVSTSCKFRTPYNALEEIRKVLAYYKIFLPKSMFLDENHGNDVFEVSQFGEKMGMNNQGEVVTASDSPLFVYFEWSLNEKGMYDAFAALVDQEELDEILADYDAEVEDDETDLQEERSMGGVSKMLYKVVNQMKASKQSDDVDSLINHEKQGKTFTQMNEEPMPNAKKMMAAKMAKKKVSLANMNKEETQLDEVSSGLLSRYVKKAKKDKKKNRKSGITLATQKKYGSDDPSVPKVKATNEETVNEIADTPRGKEAVRQAIHRADATVVDSAINPPRSKKGKRLAKNAMKTVDRGIAVHKKQGGVLDNYLKRSYGIKEESEQLDEISKKKLGQYIKAASHDVATKSAATGRYGDRANRARDEMKKGEYKNWPQGKKDDEFADKMFKKSWNRRKGIAKAVDKLTKE